LVLYQALLQSAEEPVLPMLTDQLLQILQVVAVEVVVEQPKTQVQIMADHLHKLCHLGLQSNMEITEVQLQTLHTNLVEVAEVLVQSVVR
jgi:hypothetical protein